MPELNLSHLQRACLDALKALDAGWVTREAFDTALADDPWVQRNPHRLARLDSTLAGLSQVGMLEMADGATRLRLPVRVWLDDDPVDRAAPAGWTHVFTASEAIALLDRGDVKALSLDHDLGDDDAHGTGYDVVLWLAEQSEAHGRDLWPAHVEIHSANFSASPRMAGVINRYSGLREHPGRRWLRPAA